MENFYDFNPQLFPSRLPTPIELKEIKQMLLSGENDQILQAVEKIKLFTNEEKPLCEIIRADISEFLCDAIKPLDTIILSAINACLELLAQHLEFYTHNHSCFAIESLIRSLHFLMKDSYSVINLNQCNRCLSLLAIILQGYNRHEVTPEKKTIENVLLLLPKLQKRLTPTINSAYQIGLVILSLTELNVSKQSSQTNTTILTCFCSWFSFLKEILQFEHPMREKLIFLCTTLCHSLIRSLVSNECLIEVFNSETDQNLINDIIFNVCEFLINFGAPYLDNASLNEAEINTSHVENFYKVILYFYSDNLSYKKRLTHGLSQVGFLQFTTRIISFDEICRSQKLRRLCTVVLFHVILSLSEDTFLFPEVWPHGRDNFRNEIENEIVEPLDPSQWLNTLISPHSSTSCKYALLMYLYFYCMTEKSICSQVLLQVIYPAIVSFIRSSIGIESSIFLLKAVWFIFVRSQLSVAESVSLDNEMEATNLIVSLLETQNDFSLVYTHHPAILYWAFSSKIKRNIQTKVVHLWLRNKTPDCREVEELIKKSSDVRYAILDILQNDEGQVLDSAFSSMKSLLNESECDDLASSIWFVLPQTLASFLNDLISTRNIDYLIELSSLKCPENVDVTRLNRIASLLPEVLLKSDLISVFPCLTLALNLLKLSLKMEDYRAVFALLKYENFVEKIIDGLSLGISDISLCSIQIFALLWKECGKMEKPERFGKIKMSKDIVLRVLETNSQQILSAALDFIQQILVTNFESTFFVIENPDMKFVEFLFLEIQNICFTTSLELSDKCWLCLKLFLHVHIRDNKCFHLELSTHPVLNELIRFFLPRLKDSKNMADFLMVWTEICNEKFQNPLCTRRIFGQFYEETIKMM